MAERMTNKQLAEWFASKPPNEEAEILYISGVTALSSEMKLIPLNKEYLEEIENPEDVNTTMGRPTIYEDY